MKTIKAYNRAECDSVPVEIGFTYVGVVGNKVVSVTGDDLPGEHIKVPLAGLVIRFLRGAEDDAEDFLRCVGAKQKQEQEQEKQQ